ncbi:NAD(P)-dependent alcohol dehydrogenase [Rhizobium sp. S152]|uniref:zinc-dependent alcohol dehydrogenase family protein n=1 Tax=Rhizobium sp. S152 TaxID=3055038 RepID=UPI0025A9BF64|nr:NAD(P)-dependent alcohol dehydrogenase [Rhizobium sp. S152]MDM9628989.1 NAD(P)-dependent alcohol dehydrogenase [Rhizobium sp. S152]
MKQWILKAGANTIEGLVETTTTRPEPGPGEVRVRVVAVSLNYREHLILSGGDGPWRPRADLVPVADGAGVIDAVGNDVTGWKIGDRVTTVYLRDFETWPPHPGIGLGLGAADEQGVLTEFVVLRADRVMMAPESLSLAEASTLPCAAVTAWTALQHANPVRPGQKVLTLGSGGVSLFAISMAKAFGADVFATTSQADKQPKLIDLGVSQTFDYRNDQNWGATFFKATGGADKIVDTAGFGSINQSIQALAFGGDIGMVGLMSFGEAIDPALFYAKGVSLRGIPVGSADQQREVFRFIDDKGIKPVIHRTFDFSEARAAYDAQLSPDTFGKIVINVSDE